MAIDRERILQAAQKYVDKRKYDRAVAEYQKIIQEDPNDARTLLKVGDLQARMQAFPEAIATYDRVGQFYAAQGFALKAIAVYKQIRELIRKHAPDLADRYGHIVPRLAEIYTQLGLTSDALAAYDEVATRLQKTGRDREAIDVFRKMVELDSANPLPHLRLAEARCRVQALDEAIDSFWTAADLLLKLGREDDALKVIERILHFRQDPHYARVAAELYLRKNDRDNGMQALAKLQIAFQADPKNIDTLALLAQAFTVIGQEAKSLEVYKEMARISRDQGRTDLFEQLLAHLRAVAPNDEQVRALESLGPPPPSRGAQASEPVSVDDEIELVEDSEPLEEAPAPHVPAARPIMTSAPDVVILDEELEAIEDDRGRYDGHAQARKAAVDAESFRKLRLYGKAIESLHIALEIDPHSIDIRHKLREVLVEAGEREGAIQETLNISIIHMDRGEYQHAEPLLYEILEIEPEHAQALELLGQIHPGDYGYPSDHQEVARQASQEIADFQSRSQRGQPQPAAPPASQPQSQSQAQYDAYDPAEPLPSYDLEEVSAASALHGSDLQGSDLSSAEQFASVDDPFANEEPLPSFPLGAEPRELEPPRSYDATESASAVEGIEEVLEEAEFFAARGLLDDAKAILIEQLQRSPNHPLLLERLQEVDQALATTQESGTIERSQLASAARPPSDRAFDIAASLDALDELEQPESEAAPSSRFDSEIDVDQVFEKFKAGVRAQVSESDSSTHYDLGVAYKEMGLVADARHEFELASRDPQRECMCFAMIGMIHLEQHELDQAASAYISALNAQQKSVEQEMSLYYDLGNVYEMKGQNQDALYYFEKIARRDPGYRDVRDRIAALKPPAPAPQSRVVGDDDEFDAVFDELFEERK